MRVFARNIYVLGAIFALVAGVNAFVGFRQVEAPIRRELEQRVEAELDYAVGEITASFALVEQTLDTAGYYVQMESDRERIAQFLAELNEQSSAYLGMYLDILDDSPNMVPGALTDDRLVYSVGTNANRRVLTASKPINGDDGERLGVVRLDTSPGDTVASLEDASGYEYFLFLGGSTVLEDDRRPSLDYSLLEGTAGMTALYRGDAHGYLRWETVGETELVVATFVPDSGLLALRIQEQRIAGVMIITSIAGAVLLFVFLRRHIVLPFRELEQDILAISLDRDVTYRLPMRQGKSLGLFRQALNSSLHKAQERHERAIRQRQELSEAYEQRERNERVLQSQFARIRENEARIQYLAEYDYLTRLFNRRKFQEDLEHTLEKKGSGAVFLLDIDDFKNINDTQGHSFGDEVLVALARLLEQQKPPGSTVYRFGGDEFVIVVGEQYELERAHGDMGNMSGHLTNMGALGKSRTSITCSMGGARFPEDGSTVDEVLVKADIALNNAKREGKNRACFFEEHMASMFGERVRSESIVAESVRTENFYLVYQPIVETSTGEIASFEAFVRVHGEPISPTMLITIAEESDLIFSIGYWVIQEVIGQLAAWKRDGIGPKPVSLNLSTKQFYDQAIVGYLKEQLDQAGIERNLLSLEITESVMRGDAEEAIRIMHEIRSLGVHLSLDNYGTGYSFANYLTRIPMDSLKIHGAVTERILDHAGVLHGLVSIAHGLGMKVVGEQVETAQQARLLREAGCDYLQGYLFSPPILPREAAGLLGRDYGDVLGLKKREEES